MYRLLILITVLLLSYCQNIFACRTGSDSSWAWTKKTLIAKTENIFVAEVFEITKSAPPKPGQPYSSIMITDYKFKIKKVIKGNGPSDYALELKNMAAPPSSAEDKGRSRARFSKDCRIQVGFRMGKTYLIFADSFNPWGYQEISESGDPWQQEVERATSQGKN